MPFSAELHKHMHHKVSIDTVNLTYKCLNEDRGLVRSQESLTRLSDGVVHSFSQSAESSLLSHLSGTVQGSKNIQMNKR